MSFFFNRQHMEIQLIADAWMMINLGVILPRVIHELRLPFSITRIHGLTEFRTLLTWSMSSYRGSISQKSGGLSIKRRGMELINTINHDRLMIIIGVLHGYRT